MNQVDKKIANEMVSEIEKMIESRNQLIAMNSGGIYSEAVNQVTDAILIKKEEYIAFIHHYKITQCEIMKRGKRKKQYRTHINSQGSQIRCSTREALIDRLYQHYNPDLYDTGITVEDVYKKYNSYRSIQADQGHRSYATIKKEQQYWQKYFAGTDFSKKKIQNVQPKDITHLMYKISEGGQQQKREINNVKSLINYIFDFAIADMNLDVLCARNVVVHDIKTVVEDNSCEVYTDDERLKIIEAAKLDNNVVYARAIQLHFNICARIGEIQALKWDDIDFENRSMHIHSQIVSGQKNSERYRVEYTKSKKITGNRRMYINDDMMDILLAQEKENPDNEYVFLYNDKFLKSDVYNKILKRICKRAGVRYLSSHKIRFWAVTHALENGMPIEYVQRMAGH